MHFEEDGTFAYNITHGVSRPLEYIYNFMAVSDKTSRILIDIKQPVRAGLTFIADDISASLLLSEPPSTVQITGPVRPNGTYDLKFLDILDLRLSQVGLIIFVKKMYYDPF